MDLGSYRCTEVDLPHEKCQMKRHAGDDNDNDRNAVALSDCDPHKGKEQAELEAQDAGDVAKFL